MLNRILYLMTFSVILHIVTSETPSYITKCKQSDGDCYRENAQRLKEKFAAGIPEDNFETMEPLYIKKIDASSPNLKLVLNDVLLRGISKCDIQKLARDPIQQLLSVGILCNVDLEAKYVMNGKLSIFPIEGEGDARAKIHKVLITGEAKMPEYVGKDGKRHWKVPSWTHEFKLLDNSEIHFDNLFKGNKNLGASVSDFISKNGNLMIEELGEPVINAMIRKIVENASRYFQKYSVQDLSL